MTGEGFAGAGRRDRTDGPVPLKRRLRSAHEPSRPRTACRRGTSSNTHTHTFIQKYMHTRTQQREPFCFALFLASRSPSRPRELGRALCSAYISFRLVALALPLGAETGAGRFWRFGAVCAREEHRLASTRATAQRPSDNSTGRSHTPAAKRETFFFFSIFHRVCRASIHNRLCKLIGGSLQ